MNRETTRHASHTSGKNDAARIGVVLSSGGGRGVYAHTGFLLALERLGIDIRAIAFCPRILAWQPFGECRYPFHAVAVDLGRGRKMVFSAGELAPRMMASAAMPVLYPPGEVDGTQPRAGAFIGRAP